MSDVLVASRKRALPPTRKRVIPATLHTNTTTTVIPSTLNTTWNHHDYVPHSEHSVGSLLLFWRIARRKDDMHREDHLDEFSLELHPTGVPFGQMSYLFTDSSCKDRFLTETSFRNLRFQCGDGLHSLLSWRSTIENHHFPKVFQSENTSVYRFTPNSMYYVSITTRYPHSPQSSPTMNSTHTSPSDSMTTNSITMMNECSPHDLHVAFFACEHYTSGINKL